MMKARIVSALAVAVLAACGGGGGGATSTPSAPSTPAPMVSVTLSQTSTFTNTAVEVSWSSNNATSCTGLDGLTGSLQTSGKQSVTASVAGTVRYTVSCTGAGGVSNATAILTVNSPTVTFNQSILQKSADADTLGYEKANQSFTASNFTINTGVWGVKSATAYSVSQTGSIDVQNNILTSFVSNWDIKSSNTPGVVAFSNVTYGKHPGSPLNNTTKLPAKIDTLGDIVVTGQANTVCFTVCGYGTAFDIFMMDSADPKPSDIGTELMITTEFTGEGGWGTPDAVVTIGNVSYRVYHNSFGSTWNTIVYIPSANNQIKNININITDFIKDAKSRGWIKGTEYLNSIEFGTEIGYGSGSTKFSNFKIQ